MPTNSRGLTESWKEGGPVGRHALLHPATASSPALREMPSPRDAGSQLDRQASTVDARPRFALCTSEESYRAGAGLLNVKAIGPQCPHERETTPRPAKQRTAVAPVGLQKETMRHMLHFTSSPHIASEHISHACAGPTAQRYLVSLAYPLFRRCSPNEYTPCVQCTPGSKHAVRLAAHQATAATQPAPRTERRFLQACSVDSVSDRRSPHRHASRSCPAAGQECRQYEHQAAPTLAR